MYCDVYGPWVGRENMVVVADVLPKENGSLLHGTPLAGALWVGLRDAAGNDPVTVNGDDALLTPITSIPFSLPAGVLPRDISIALPEIPASADDAVWLFQIAVSDGVSLAYSDVFGIETRSNAPWE